MPRLSPPLSESEFLEKTAQWLDRRSEAALGQALPEVYGELRRLAGSYLRGERPGHTLPAHRVGARSFSEAAKNSATSTGETVRSSSRWLRN
jgi:hypothetical protein